MLRICVTSATVSPSGQTPGLYVGAREYGWHEVYNESEMLASETGLVLYAAKLSVPSRATNLFINAILVIVTVSPDSVIVWRNVLVPSIGEGCSIHRFTQSDGAVQRVVSGGRLRLDNDVVFIVKTVLCDQSVTFSSGVDPTRGMILQPMSASS